MSEDSAVRRVVEGWRARGLLTLVREQELRTLAAVAIQAAGAPQTWDVGDVVPRGVDYVWDDRGLRWTRDTGPRGNGVWICYAPESRLTELVGPVTEDMVDQPGPNPGACRGCGALPGDVHADDCAHRVPRSEPMLGICLAGNEDYPELRCSLLLGHPGDHHDIKQGGTWPQAVDAPPLGVCSAKHPERQDVVCHIHHHPATPRPLRHTDVQLGISWVEAPGPPDKDQPDTTVVLERDAVVGLQGLLETVAAKLARVHTAYKGPAIKHADTMADQCTQTATLLRDVLGDQTGENDE